MTEPCLVSVITPCYNAAPFVAETIESVRAQTWPDVEHIVVDDGSTDESWAVVQACVQRGTDGRLRAARLPANRGGSHARNQGAALARGEYMMFLDADDLIAPDTLRALVEALGERPMSVAICPWQELHRVEGAWRASSTEVPLPDPAGDVVGGWLAGSRWAPPCAVLWRRDAYEHTGGWDEEITANDDGDLMLRALLGGVRLVVTHAGCAYYRRHGDARLSLSGASFTEAWFASQMRVLDKVAAVLERQGRTEAFRRPLGLAYHRLALLAFQREQPALARRCQRAGERYVGQSDFSPTRLGRLLTRAVGLERKERLALWLAARGVLTPRRRKLGALRGRYLAGGLPGPTPPGATVPRPVTRGVDAPVVPVTADEGDPKVTVCVASYCRPEGLRQLLEALGRLTFTESRAPRVEIVVVDNDALGSAASVCETDGPLLPWPVRYVHEPRRGIATARNTAVRVAMAGADFIAFIDDDETPDARWLDELLSMQRASGADVVTGPTLARFETPAPGWVIAGGFFDPPRYRTGATLERAYTGNVFVRSRVFRGMEGHFEERLNLSGGEDVHFFRRAVGRGFTVVWNGEAIVSEWVPASRATVRWLVWRAYRVGNVWSICDRDLAGSRAYVALRSLRAVGRIGKALMLMPFGLVQGRHVLVRRAQAIARGLGYLVGAAGYRYDEYRGMQHGARP
jgi:glycosyltransferase involved in cell wall biosynthesis